MILCDGCTKVCTSAHSTISGTKDGRDVEVNLCIACTEKFMEARPDLFPDDKPKKKAKGKKKAAKPGEEKT